MEIAYTFGNKYIVISQNRIQSRQYLVNKITVGELARDTGKSLVFNTANGERRIAKRTISDMIDITFISVIQTQFYMNRIEDALKYETAK